MSMDTSMMRKPTAEELATLVGDPADDLAGFWYAWGRLDQGHDPVVPSPGDTAASSTGTAWWFGHLYAEHRAADRVTTYGIPTAWEHFVASQGHTLDRKEVQA